MTKTKTNKNTTDDLISKFGLPILGNDPSSEQQGTTPGSFANLPEIGGARSFSSPDTPGMPQPSDKTAWDFMPPDWQSLPDGERTAESVHPALSPANAYSFSPPDGPEDAKLLVLTSTSPGEWLSSHEKKSLQLRIR